MIGIDTNVLIRYLAQDDAAQAALANDLIDGFTDSRPGFVTTIVLAETYWVLRHAYQTDREAIARLLQGLLESSELIIERADPVRRALVRVAAGADFADALINELGADAGCERTVTFDQKTAKKAGMQLLTDS